ncbi:MAG: hypothetical protein ABIJ45_00620 [Candidatus Zixiibacteriota bacterium]
MKLSLLKVSVIFLLILTTTAYGQIQQGLSFNFFGGGARSEGMGQAFLAISDDGTAASWNPAGLHFQEQTFMTIAYSSLAPKGKLGYAYYQDPLNPQDGDGTLKYFDHGGTVAGLNYLHIISPVRISGHHFVLDLGYTRNFDVYSFYADKLFKNPFDSLQQPNSFTEKTGYLSAINIGFGTRIYEGLSFGVTGNIYTGKVVTDERRQFSDTLNDSLQRVLGGEVEYYSHVQALDSSSFSGFNASIGFMYNSGPFRAGLVVRTPFTLDGESDNTYYYLSTENNLPIETNSYSGMEIFRSDTVYINDQTFKMEMPFMLGFGLGYNLTDNLLLAADLEYRAFSGMNIELLENITIQSDGTANEIFKTVPSYYADILQLRFGAEYLLDTKFGEIPIRAGIRSEAYPQGFISYYDIKYIDVEDLAGNVDSLNVDVDSTAVQYTYVYDESSILDGFSFSLGTGIHWSQIKMDIAYTYTYYDQYIFRQRGINPSENEWKNHHLNFTFTGYF